MACLSIGAPLLSGIHKYRELQPHTITYWKDEISAKLTTAGQPSRRRRFHNAEPVLQPRVDVAVAATDPFDVIVVLRTCKSHA